jgi:catalase
MSEAEKKRLVANIAVHLTQVSKDDIVERSVSHFRNADRNYGDRVFRAVMEQRANRKYATRISI